MDFSGFDPNTVAGWLILAGVVVGTVWRFSSFLRKFLGTIVEEKHAEVLDRLDTADENHKKVLDKVESVAAKQIIFDAYVINHDARIAHMEGKLGLSLGSLKSPEGIPGE